MSTNDDNGGLTFQVYDAGDVGRAIRALRLRRGWTQSDLAEWLSVHRVTVAKLERGGSVDLPLAVRAIGVLGGAVIIHGRRGDADTHD